MNDLILENLMARLKESNNAFVLRYRGLDERRQPVHTVYGGAHLYKSGASRKLAMLAQGHFAEYAQNERDLALALGFDIENNAMGPGSLASVFKLVFERVKLKLVNEAVEDHRVDFEDGYGVRSDEEEDRHVESSASAMATDMAEALLPPFVGIRIKALSEEAKHRSLRTLLLYLDTLLSQSSGVLPPNFIVTLPKVISIEQVNVVSEFLEHIENQWGLEDQSIQLELMLENVQCLFDEYGSVLLPKFIAAGKGRVSGVILGTFDYTASGNIAAHYQTHTHPSADFARQMMLSCLTGTDVAMSDGITNIMPIAPHKGDQLSQEQEKENYSVVTKAWKLHFDNICHSLELGIYQGWDLNPAQIPIRYAAIYYFFLTGLEAATNRLRTFINKAAQASMVGNTFDDAATGQGLVNFFVNGINCGALTEAEALETGITLDELKKRSFKLIVENRIRN
jgi:citrate lyase beta subunit